MPKSRLSIFVVMLLAGVVYLQFTLAESEELTPLVISEASQPVFSLLYIAKVKGYFEDEGLDITFRSFTSGRDALQDVLDGNADLATSYETPIVLQSLAGEKLKIISSLHFSNKNTAMLALKASGINKPNDLEGKTIAVPKNTNAHFFLNMLLASEGIKPDSVTIIDVKPENLHDALHKEQTDAVAIWNPHLYKIRSSVGKEAVENFYSNAYTEFSVLVGSEALVSSKHEEMSAVLRALVKAEQFLLSSPLQAKELVINYLPSHPRESIEGTWDDYQKVVKLNNVLVTVLEQEAKWISKEKQLTTDIPDFRMIIDTEFVRTVKASAVTLL